MSSREPAQQITPDIRVGTGPADKDDGGAVPLIGEIQRAVVNVNVSIQPALTCLRLQRGVGEIGGTNEALHRFSQEG